MSNLLNTIPVDLAQALHRYVHQHLSPGGFLTAVLENDLFGAVSRADAVNLTLIKEIAQYVYWELPSPCHGSPQKVAAWLDYSGDSDDQHAA
jgi:hypothetical protein